MGRIAADPVTVAIRNSLSRTVSGTVRATSPSEDIRMPPASDFTAAAGQAAEVRVAPKLARERGHALGLVALPIELSALGRAHRGGAVTVELVEQRSWLTTKGSYRESQMKNLPFDERGEPIDPKAWKPARGDAAVPADAMLDQRGDVAYAYTRVFSPEDRPVGFRMQLVGAEARIWINGDEAYRSAAPGKRETAEEAGDELLRDMGASLKKGWNPCMVEIHRKSRRYLDPPLAILDRNGQCLRDLAFDSGGKDEPSARANR